MPLSILLPARSPLVSTRRAQHRGGLSTRRVPGGCAQRGAPLRRRRRPLAFDAANKFTNFPGFQLAFPPAPSL